MSRRRRSSDDEVTLFPFLAVLICTMGSLIVLLVVVVQQAGSEPPPEEVAVSPPPQEVAAETQQHQQLQQQHDDLSWKAEVLAGSRAETQRRLQQQHAELSRAEDQTRRLQDQLESLYQKSKLIQASYERQLQDNDHSQEQQVALQSQIETAEEALESAKQARRKRSKQFALIPYEGPNGTRRKPIYIECRGDQVVLQPEGIELLPDDFHDAAGNNNALANIVRAMREYYVNQGVVENSTEPYPLIIVRPDGPSAYSACRSALSAWEDEFGYELVPEQMELAYPKQDPQLRELMQRVLDDTRWAQKAKAAVTANRRGGLSRRGGPGQSGTGRIAGGSAGAPYNTSNARGGSAGGVDLALGYSGNSSAGRAMQPSTGQAGGAGGDGNGTSDGNGRSRTGEDGGDSLAGAGGTGGPSAQPGGFAANAGGASGGMGSRPNSAAASSSASQSSGVSAVSIATSQGSNWALPGATRGAIGIQRPVTLVCRPDALVITPESGLADEPISVPIQTGVAAAVRQLVSAIWDRVDSWGIAGPGTYWKPTIHVTVAADAEMRFQELAALLKDSGLEIIRKQQP